LPYGISCISATVCTAVGYYIAGTGPGGEDLTLAEAWNGKKWALEPTPNTSAQENSLSGVWCTSATACAAVGGYTSNLCSKGRCTVASGALVEGTS
jgi:hypothetical protein